MRCGWLFRRIRQNWPTAPCTSCSAWRSSSRAWPRCFWSGGSATRLWRRCMLSWARFALPAVFLAQALIVNLPGAAERPPAMPDLSRFPTTLLTTPPATSGSWDLVSEEKIDPAVEGQLGADQVFSRTYRKAGPAPVGEGAGLVNLFVAWFQSQRGGRTQPHSPKVCLPGAGWTAEDSGEVQIQTPAESIPANRLVASNLGQRAVVLYWYQT